MSTHSSLPSEDEEAKPFLIKFAILGDTMTGKSSLLSRFLTDRMSMHYTPTGSLQIHQKTLQLSDNQPCTLEFWDVPGRSLFSPFIINVIQQADAVVLVYDVTQPCTLKALDRWMTVMTSPQGEANNQSTMKKYQPQRRHPPVILIGNKVDLPAYRLVPASLHYQFVEFHDVFTYFVSAKQPETVFTTFLGILNEVLGDTQPKQQLKGMVKRLSIAQLPVPTQSIKSKRAVLKTNCCVQ